MSDETPNPGQPPASEEAQPAEGTRRKLILDTIEQHVSEGDYSAPVLADAIEAALIANSPEDPEGTTHLGRDGLHEATSGAQPESGLVLYSRDNLPNGFEENAKAYRKEALITAVKLANGFEVQVDGQPQNTIAMPDGGYLAIDSRGYPYPIAVEEFDSIYVPALPKAPVDELPALRDALDLQNVDDSQLAEAINRFLAAKDAAATS